MNILPSFYVIHPCRCSRAIAWSSVSSRCMDADLRVVDDFHGGSSGGYTPHPARIATLIPHSLSWLQPQTMGDCARCGEERLEYLRILHLRTLVGPPYKTDALGHVKDAKESWLFGKPPAATGTRKSFRKEVTSVAAAAERHS